MFANGNSYGNSQSNLGWSMLLPTPRWFLPVMVWRTRPGK